VSVRGLFVAGTALVLVASAAATARPAAHALKSPQRSEIARGSAAIRDAVILARMLGQPLGGIDVPQ
jgi:hypothetical protein